MKIWWLQSGIQTEQKVKAQPDTYNVHSGEVKQYIELNTISCNAVLIEYILFQHVHKFSLPDFT